MGRLILIRNSEFGIRNLGENFSKKNFYLFKLLLCALDVLCKLYLWRFPLRRAESSRPTEVSANLEHRYALLSEEGVSEADGWCLRTSHHHLWLGKLWICANYNHCNPGRGAPSRRALQRFSANLEHRHALLSEEGGSDS